MPGDDDAPDLSLVVDDTFAGERLDKVLARQFPDVSRARFQSLIRDGAVRLDGHMTSDAKLRLREGQTLDVVMPALADADPKPEAMPLDVVFEDGDLIVINKPAGLVVHPGPGHGKGTLVNGLLAHCGESLSGIGGVKRPGIVHRLDRDTSGLIVVAKTDRAHQHLSEQFANHGRDGRMRRDYRAFVWGRPDHPKGMVDAPVGRSHTHRTRMAVVAEGAGRQAVTHYTLHRSWPSPDAVQPTGDAAEPLISDMTLALETGRTHQIRVHLAHIRHPVVGDPVYGAGFATRVNRLPEGAATSIAALGRQALHAMTLGFEHPESGEPMLFAAPLPDDMADVAQSLGWPRDLGNLN